MSSFISPSSGYWFLALFGVGMISITLFFARWKRCETKDGFLVAGRNVNWFLGGTSIAASWIWAPALFISVQMAYQSGTAGIFWFTAPNILALAIFAILGPRIRKRMPEGYTLPQYIGETLKSKRVHRMYLVPYFFYQLMSITVQIFAGGNLVALLTGIQPEIVMLILTIIALSYTLISGLAASVITDFVQIALIVLIGAVILPMSWDAAGGIESIKVGLGGTAGIKNILDPGVAFSFGIVTSISLISGAICDQQYWQRSFAIRKNQLIPAFVFGAILFGIVPIALSSLGFIAANPAMNIVLPEGIDVSMIGVQTVTQLLAPWAVFLFVIMLLSGLSSTLDSGFSAASSLWVTDIAKPTTDAGAVREARKAIVGIAIVGLLVALAVLYIPSLGLRELWWIFNAVAACVVVPTVLSLFWNRLSERGVFWGVLVSFVTGLPLFVYANIIGDATWIVGTSLYIVLVSTGFCLAFPKRK